jgi:ABC-2 type transport system ATP-binding protein
MKSIISVNSLYKTYKTGFKALKNVSLEINKGEIFALLGPNGAGKTTLISIITGITIPTSGLVKVNNFDVIKDPIKTRSIIGLVPQEIAIEPFETVLSSIKFSRGLFGKPQNPDYLKIILKQLSLWDKRNTKIIELSGGMKRRVLIAKALSHEPLVLFLDEPTAGVDVELRKDMWNIIKSLKENGVTIILTTHYIEEAENLADRVGFINNGEISLIDDKKQLIDKMGKKTLSINIHNSINNIPKNLMKYKLEISNNGATLIYNYNINHDKTGITRLMNDLSNENIILKDIKTNQSSLEDIFIDIVGKQP